MAGEGAGGVQESMPRRSDVHQFCTWVCTGIRCDSWCEGDQSFLMNFVTGSTLGALTDARGEFLDLIEHLAPLCHLAADLLLGIHDRGVIAAERLTDLGQR